MWFYIWIGFMACCVLALPIAAMVESIQRKKALAALQKPEPDEEAGEDEEPAEAELDAEAESAEDAGTAEADEEAEEVVVAEETEAVVEEVDAEDDDKQEADRG